MHVFTHVRPEYEGKAGMGKGFFYADGMWEMDQNVGKLLALLDSLKIADNTIVIFTTDNGPNMFTWPDAAVTPFRSEKDSNWEGAFRVPAMIRWPGKIQAGSSLQRALLRARLVPHAARRRGRAEYQGTAAQGHQRRRQDLQGAPRRLQPVALSHWPAAARRPR